MHGCPHGGGGGEGCMHGCPHRGGGGGGGCPSAP